MSNVTNELCEECLEGYYEFIMNDWQRMAFNDEEYVWVYECNNCGHELVTTKSLE